MMIIIISPNLSVSRNSIQYLESLSLEQKGTAATRLRKLSRFISAGWSSSGQCEYIHRRIEHIVLI
jgi:hypothetical protein